jgi:hypothetical protein
MSSQIRNMGYLHNKKRFNINLLNLYLYISSNIVSPIFIDGFILVNVIDQYISITKLYNVPLYH